MSLIKRFFIVYRPQVKFIQQSYPTLHPRPSCRVCDNSSTAHLASLPEVAFVGLRRSSHIPRIRLRIHCPGVAALRPPVRAAGKQHQEHGEEEQDHARQRRPDRRVEACGDVGIGAVDFILDDAKGDEVGDDDHERHDPGQEAQDGGDEGADDGGAERGEEGEEGQAAGDGVQDHDAREDSGDALGAELFVGGGLQHLDWGVADLHLRADVRPAAGRCVSCMWLLRWEEADLPAGGCAVAKRSECNDIFVLQLYFQQGDVVDHRSGDGGDEEEDRCCEEQEGADMGDETHLCCRFLRNNIKWSFCLWLSRVKRVNRLLER